MNALVILIPVALVLGLIGLLAFFWALKNDQYDDLDGAAMRILIDDEDALKPLNLENKITEQEKSQKTIDEQKELK